MSVSPSIPQGAPSLAEVLITRTFAKPTNPFVDGEFLQALEHAHDGEPKTAIAPAKPGSGAGSTPQDGETGEGRVGPGPGSAPRAGARIDVRV
jgi:hypothetical protein